MMQIIALYTLYAIGFIFVKQALLFAQPIFFTGARMVTAGIVSYGLHRWWYRPISFKSLRATELWYIFLLAIFNVYLTNANEAWSLQYLSAATVAFIYNLSPFFSLFFSWWMFKEKITLKKIIGMSIACACICPFLIDESLDQVVDSTARVFGVISIAEIVMIVAAAATALGWVLMKYLMEQRADFNSYFLNATSLTLGGMLCFAQAYAFEARPLVTPHYFLDFLGYVLLTMFLTNLVAYNFNAYLLKKYSATLVILFSFIMPIITALLGFVMLSEPLTIHFFVCSAGVALGLVIFYQEELKENLVRN
jgi:drug/metabolite transporter (DMT)-like permease